MAALKHSYYASQILRVLFNSPGSSRADLASGLELDRATVTNVVSYLIEQGYVQEQAGLEGRRSGRRPVPLWINEGFGCAVGVEVQPDSVGVSVISPVGRELFSKRESITDAQNDVVGAVKSAVNGIRPDLDQRGLRLLGVGAGLSGIVNRTAGTMEYSDMLGVRRSRQIAEPLRNEFGVPVFIDNDANCCCHGVLAYPQYKNPKDFLYCFCQFEDDLTRALQFERIMIGIGLVFDNRLYTGSQFRGGEFRSAFADKATKCQWGFHSHEEYVNIKSDFDMLGEFIDEVSRNIAFLANVLDLSAVYFGGGIELYQTLVRPALLDAVTTNWIYQRDLPRELDIHSAQVGEMPVSKGAAGIVLSHIFSGPDYQGSELVGLEYLKPSTNQ